MHVLDTSVRAYRLPSRYSTYDLPVLLPLISIVNPRLITVILCSSAFLGISLGESDNNSNSNKILILIRPTVVLYSAPFKVVYSGALPAQPTEPYHFLN